MFRHAIWFRGRGRKPLPGQFQCQWLAGRQGSNRVEIINSEVPRDRGQVSEAGAEIHRYGHRRYAHANQYFVGSLDVGQNLGPSSNTAVAVQHDPCCQLCTWDRSASERERPDIQPHYAGNYLLVPVVTAYAVVDAHSTGKRLELPFIE